MKTPTKISQAIIKCFIFFIIFCHVIAAECHGKPGARVINSNPTWKGEHKLIKMHKYGKLFEIGEGSTKMKMIHVYGDMYQMGYAHGTLLKEEIGNMIYSVWDYLKVQFQDILPKKIPAFLQKPTSALVVSAALDLTYQITLPFTNKKYYEEMRGISDASGVPLKLFRRIHMIGQLTKGTCSMFGAWGKATTDSGLIQLRALDWDVEGPFWKYPLITVYHPSSKKFGNPWLNVGFYGWIGVISGVNSQKLAISEIGVYFNDDTFGKESRFGNPFTFVLRDILQWDKTLNESIARLKSAKRTCNLILGVGDGNINQFRAFQYSHSVLNVVNDTHPLPKNDTWHAGLQNVVYYAMDWLCPSYNLRLYELLTEHYGSITVENTISHIMPGVNSGNLQAVVYDLPNQWIYFSYGIVNQNKKVLNAYERPFIGLSLAQLFAEPTPQL